MPAKQPPDLPKPATLSAKEVVQWLELRARGIPLAGPDAVQEDDITMVTLRRSVGAAAGSFGGGVLAAFEVPSAPGNERQAIERVERAVAGLGLGSARLERLKTAVAEATMNAREHGNRYRSDRPVSIRVLHGAGSVRVQISNRGDAGELAEPEAPDLEAKLEGRQRPRGTRRRSRS